MKTLYLSLIVINQLCYWPLKVGVKGDEENCDDLYHDSVNKNKYSKENNAWYEFVENISKAENEYTQCENQACSSCHDEVFQRDLHIFKDGGITKEMMNKASSISRITKYQIIKGQVYRSKDCMFPFRCEGIEHFLSKVASNVPNTEFYVNTRDWPQLNKHFNEKVPVFSFSKTEEFFDIMYPAWAFWGGGPAIGLYPRGLGRWDEHLISLKKASAETPWKFKKDIGFFRGSRTSSERDSLVILSRQCPNVIDAQYTKNQAWKSPKDTLGMEPAIEASLESHCKYKFLFNFRGVAASFRLKHLFLCRSLVFHVGSEWQEFFYPALKPWIHYIPVPSDAKEKDLFNMIEFFKNHQDLAEKIANTGADFIENHLRMNDVECYWYKLLREYTKLLKYKIERDSTLVKISA